MSKRSSQTPLYEMMLKRRERGSGSVEGPQREGSGPAEGEAGSVGARTVRLPRGYLLLGAAAVIFICLTIYMLAYWRGERNAKAELDQDYLQSAAMDPSRRAEDPLLPPEGGEGPTRRGNGSDGEGNGADSGSGALGRPAERFLGVPGDSGVGRGPELWGAIESDPRVSGMHYLVLAETRPAGAVRLAEFCRSQGLEAYAVSSNNARFRRIIVLPGFASRSRSVPEAAQLIDEVQRIGRMWKSEDPGGSDLSDAYFAP